METRHDKVHTERVEVPEALNDSVVELVEKKLCSSGSKRRLVTDIEIGKCNKGSMKIGSGALPIDIISRTFQLYV